MAMTYPQTAEVRRPRAAALGRAGQNRRFRRALVLMLMTLVLPGSAQLACGNRRVGRIALRVVLVSGAVVGLSFLVGLVFHSFIFFVFSNTFVLGVIRVGLMGLALAWAFLFVDAWRLADPLSMARKQRLMVVGLNGLLCLSMTAGLLYASHVVAVQKDFIATMFGGTTVVDPYEGRYNILLLGGDSGADRWGMRPDSLTVASIDEDTGETVLFGLPRNMLNFPFAEGSLMSEQFPNGYDCGPECELNSLGTWAADHKDLFKGIENPGIEATSQAVEGITGLKINYWAYVNLEGFTKMVDAVGGVKLRVRERIPIGGVGGPVTGYIEPGHRKLNGYQTLWFARSRESADDYSRMARQKCVMGAMLNQLSPAVVVTKFEAITKASSDLVSTNLPAAEIGNFVNLALKAKSQKIKTVSFVPPLIKTGDPDFDKIRKLVEKAITPPDPEKTHNAGATKQGKPKKAKAPGKDAGTTGGAVGSLSQGYAANQADDLAGAC